jgi:hypothetical protein
LERTGTLDEPESYAGQAGCEQGRLILFGGLDDCPIADEKLFEFQVLFGVDEACELAAVDEPVIEKFPDECDVLLPACGELAESEVVFFQAQT